MSMKRRDPRPLVLQMCVLAALATTPGNSVGAAAQPNVATTCLSFGVVRVGADQIFTLTVAYPPQERPGAAGGALNVLAAFDLYESPADGGAKRGEFTRSQFLETRSFEATLTPGEAWSIGSPSLSGYAQSHLSLLGPTQGQLEEQGISVTGDLSTVVAGRARTIATLTPVRCGSHGREVTAKR
jgi:hypothetical protein